MKPIDYDPFNYAKWNAINYCMSADFLQYYADKYPEPPENPFHSDLGDNIRIYEIRRTLFFTNRKRYNGTDIKNRKME